jgi:RNA polymerase sigma-70 factor (TIGR02943 family)
MAAYLIPENWVNEHSDYLYSYAILRIFNKEDALDLIQDTFFSALKAKDSFKGESTERTWLTAILKRKIIDHYRKKAGQKESFTINANENIDDVFEQTTGSGQGHWKKERAPKEWTFESNTLESDEFQLIFNNCLSLLPPAWAATFTLRSMEDYTTEEICKELNISSSNLWTTIHRAKLQLRECMEIKWFGKRKTKI